MAEDELTFDFESQLEPAGTSGSGGRDYQEPPDLPAEAIGQQPGNFKKNYRQTVCTYWLRGLCMKGDTCGFLHQFDSERMPVCRALLKYGECKEPDCPFKHSLDEIKECNMYRLGFCIYGPQCRYKHKRLPGPPPEPDELEAAKPKEVRNINAVVNQVNPGVAREDERLKRTRYNNSRQETQSQPSPNSYVSRPGTSGGQGEDHDVMKPAPRHSQGHEDQFSFGNRDYPQGMPHMPMPFPGMPPLFGGMPPIGFPPVAPPPQFPQYY